MRFSNKYSLKVAKRLSVLSSTDSGHAKSITNVILAELTKVGLTSSTTLSYEAPFVHRSLHMF